MERERERDLYALYIFRYIRVNRKCEEVDTCKLKDNINQHKP